MDKIHKDFYPQIYDLFNLWQAFVKAAYTLNNFGFRCALSQ